MPVRVGQFVVGQSGATTQGDGRSWDLSFVKATRWITQPVGWWGGDWGAARPGRRRRLDYAGWSINNIRIHAGLICESCLYDVSFTDLQATTRQETTSIHPLSCRRTPQKETLRVTSPCHLHVVGNKRTDDGLVGHTLHTFTSQPDEYPRLVYKKMSYAPTCMLITHSGIYQVHAEAERNARLPVHDYAEPHE